MKLIQSRQNAQLKQWWRIAQGKDKTSCLLEGIHLCQAYVQHYGQPQWLLLNQAHYHETQIAQLIQQLQALQMSEQQMVLLPEPLFKQLCTVPSPQGIAFVIATPQISLHPDINETCLLLDRIQDPGNLGTILRTAAAVDIKHVLLSKGTVNAWSAKVLRSAQGAHFVLNIYSQIDLVAWCQNSQLAIYASTLDQDSVDLYKAKLAHPCAWLFGNEGQGLDPHLQTLAQQKVFIPQSRQVESLNVAIASAVILFEQRRQQLLTQ
ncbi:TrmH family RNA methyltransferase [Brackiella oedipodis]|uniref:TrmH family RNA methyltransferase n=1 Tax=Brackiella oedipodis TaxID=124225 RepID=UPI00048C5F1C|nr:RNA methyltransferase [Brackiella oedipodis]